MDDADCGHWEDEIDIDDSDLPSLLNNPVTSLPSNNPGNYNPTTPPSLQRCSQPHPKPQPQNPNPSPPSLLPQSQPRIDPSPPKNRPVRPKIPGPAGAVQAAMHRTSSAFQSHVAFNSQGRQVDRRFEDLAGEEGDGDFKLNPWRCAVTFLGEGFDLRWSIGSIKNRKRAGAADRIPQGKGPFCVVGVVKSCVPNGLGDLFITLKDPTGIIGAYVHRNVLKEANFGVGCALILKQVAVFCPVRSACYLNVTISNMVKHFSKECGPPDKQMTTSSEARYCGVGKQMDVGRGMVEKLTSRKQGGETNDGRLTDFRKKDITGSLPYNVTATSATMAAKFDLRTSTSTDVTAKLTERTTTMNMVDKPDSRAAANLVGKIGPGASAAENVASKGESGSTKYATTNMAVDPDIRTKEPKKATPNVSVAQWTDEQLLELFADYQDDAEFVHHGI